MKLNRLSLGPKTVMAI